MIRRTAMVFMLLMTASVFCFAQNPNQATPNEQRVAMPETATAHDAFGRAALTAKLRDAGIHGSIDSPQNNARLVITNAGSAMFTYVTGWVTFYDAEGVRCGEGLFKVNELAPGEAAETDTPGLRLVCTPSTWRLLATNLLTHVTDAAQPNAVPPVQQHPAGARSATPVPPLVLSIDGEDHPIQIGNPMTINNGTKTVTLVLKRAN